MSGSVTSEAHVNNKINMQLYIMHCKHITSFSSNKAVVPVRCNIITVVFVAL